MDGTPSGTGTQPQVRESPKQRMRFAVSVMEILLVGKSLAKRQGGGNLPEAASVLNLSHMMNSPCPAQQPWWRSV
ncbi:hypothetical protein Aam_120_008 [Acidocella aminolytica 101 = DSM 11237]|uniref:Uncharacterized protein n=1 Tax=Acidocella aminolytica 101 = DSM 11237 TaxID=1120923 RepID=A0A0D6PM03_9PROT|nr:hypothetical protein Aam_120_008 [Acidocella aminolytica 101 = DSM 11237]GBQ39159.1 hypothetical protein AA11237_1983 [Acidocella aminolytica 101 = DSM 11237]